MQHYPIYIIGAGGIVHDAHLPAYKIAGYHVAGIYDLSQEKAAALAGKFPVQHVFDNLATMIAEAGTNGIYDIALPGAAVPGVLQQLPDGATVLIQKPMGDDLWAAKNILAICREKKLVAGINFQLRYAPYIQEARQMIEDEMIGEICDMEVNINVYTPWQLWDFLYKLPRVEILYHSIHYVDLIRSFLGNPQSVFAKTVKHPGMKELASVRTNMIMDYGEMIRANILTNHGHNYGLEQQHSYIKIEGTRGAIKIGLGVLMNYPQGVEDSFKYIVLKEGTAPHWQTKKIEGTWFPHAFIGSMDQMMLAKSSAIPQPDNSVEDCIYTMACVEAAYAANEQGGIKPDDFLT